MVLKYIYNGIVLLHVIIAITIVDATSSMHRNNEAYNLLLKIANYTSYLDVGTNSLSNATVHFDASGGTDHIFVNANLARILLSTYRLQEKEEIGNGNRDYLEQGLAWCDTFSDLQANIISSLTDIALS